MDGREIDRATPLVLAPGLIDADHLRAVGIELLDPANDPGHHPQFFFLGKTQDLRGVHAGRTVPEIDLAAIALHGGIDELAGRRQQAVEIVVPEINPVGQPPGVGLQERSQANSQTLLAAPLDLPIASRPVEAAFRGLHVAPINGHHRHVEGGQEGAGRRLVHFRAAQRAAQQRRQPARRPAADGDHLIGIGRGQELRAVQGDAQGFLGRRPVAAALLDHGPTEFEHGLFQQAVHLVGNRQADRLPLVKLAAKQVDRAAGKFQGEVIRLPAFDQRAGGKGQQAVTFHVPGDRYRAGIRDIPLQHQFAVIGLGMHDPRRAIHARHIGELQHFFRDALRR